MTTRYWIADLHLRHKKVSEIRGHENTEDHDDVILNHLKWKLREGDQLWILGDIVGRADHDGYALSELNNVKHNTGAELHLIAGNHDSVSSIHRNGYKHQKEWLRVFDSIQQYGRFTFDGEQVFMSHYPYARSGDGANREGVRYLEYRLPDIGNPLMHGHTHQSTPHMEWRGAEVVTPGNLPTYNIRKIADVQQLCVSWDAWGRLVTERDVADWIRDWKIMKSLSKRLS